VFDCKLKTTLFCPKCNNVLQITESNVTLSKHDNKVKGLYIAFEGIDGSGKTLQSQKMAKTLRSKGYNITYVREPWDEKLKNFLYNHELEPDVETYVFAIDRIMLQRKIVLKALKEGNIVISDRSVYASLAYQGARGLPLEFILFVNRTVKMPDIVILLDIPVDEALERIKRRRRTRFEEREYLEKVREIYLKLPQIFRNTIFIVVDASKNINEVEREIQIRLIPILKNSLDR